MTTSRLRFRSPARLAALAFAGAALFACGDDTPVYPQGDVGAGGDASEATACDTFLGSCSESVDGGTDGCGDFRGPASMGAAFQSACEENDSLWSSQTCTQLYSNLNAGCQTNAGTFCTTGWTEVADEDMTSFESSCAIGGGVAVAP